MNRRALVPRVAGVLVTVACVLLLGATVDLAAAATILASAAIAPIAIAVAILGLELTLRAERWSLLLPLPGGVARPPLRRVLAPLAIGYLGNTLLPSRLGEPIRAFALAQREGLDPAATFGAVIVERLIDTATLAAVGAAAALTVGGPPWLLGGTIVVLAGSVIVGLIALAAALVRTRSARRPKLDARVTQGRGLAAALDRVLRLVMRTFDGLDVIRRPVRVAEAALISSACWGLDAAIFWLVARAVGVDLSMEQALLVAVVAVLATALPSAPGYIGTYELAASTAAMAIGVSPAQAVALALLAHVVTTVPVALAGALALATTGGSLSTLARRATATLSASAH